MSMTRLTVYQGIYIFSTMSDKTRTKKLNISNNDLSLVPSEYISKGLNKLVEVDVCGTKLTDIQMMQESMNRRRNHKDCPSVNNEHLSRSVDDKKNNFFIKFLGVKHT